MRILVTGGAGFIGTNLVRSLLEQGHEVIVLDNLITGHVKNVLPFIANPRFTFIEKDIINPFVSAKNEILTVDQIYHLACPTGVNNLGSLAEEMLLTCAIGTKNVLELAKVHKTRFLFTSSSEVYGDPEVSPQKEEYTGNVDPTGFRSPYEEGKRFAESLIISYVRKYNLDATIVRVFNTYGPQMSPKDTRVIPRLLRLALTKKPLTIHGKGLQRRTFCYVDDFVKGLILVMGKGKKGQVYNLGSESEFSIIELAQIILEMTKTKSTFKFTKRPAHDHQMRLPALEKIKKLGWRPKTSLKEGLKKTINLQTESASLVHKDSMGKKEEKWQQYPAF
ncbi:hypothetical protein A2697_02705 [Candidatus Curtissbacteria bacterium RIFCSPHIGHO2_01_FULL_41_44]|uniref:NAD-dependent epimerase/dehydratase domain-containing protein n=1 Tax=Candidatus Curtissbacteria bacterium RIFCSPLOWO2_01_FULL_42_50 TaxID=1797730 RepID=A0A1F5H899_9BACT|nr:MAG: hypothetical protein A2697_02705 [Candidatus Curtissbacteria bacterium RIFCSPHIGHO2_01_FULL_41_44]OGD92479.1 MAG: hypothetical protein A3C33_04795 [Candidatus Curtissbacteria bacterium RIFCSPHIGHO2_02_FULL_42_58]OGD96272.1 MAG: hypothetical protein A3E71_02290 [Candidatus Curtissbacteria bacterium RIFCSPHIGHO2_12_FULL_42_33]OGE00361.1 MAG: hypothetical protein A3B54_01470 [Candidatus Curtissbacteria bacterium RIFCSPLOWO2_01_FULL_42_50]OGE03810.1 MAG: hypothetical protein A3G16_05040 [Ca